MDKKSLTPELKQIYEKVMSTPTRPQMQQPGAQMASTQQIPQTSIIPPAPPPPVGNFVPPAPPGPPPVTSFSSVSPQAIKSTTGTFVFSNKNNSSGVTEPHTITASRAGNSKALPVFIGFLVIIFVITYTFIWMVVFDLIKLPF